VENSVEKVENTVGNPASFSQIQWKTQWKKLKDDSSGDKTRERNGRRGRSLPQTLAGIFLNGVGKHDTMVCRKALRKRAAKFKTRRRLPMNWITKLERKFGRYCIPNLISILIGGQILVYAVELFVNQYISFYLNLDRGALLAGQIWRVITFMFVPFSGGGPLIDLGVHFIDLAMYFMGSPKPVAVSGCTYCKFADSTISDSVHSQFGEKVAGGTFDVEDLSIGFIRFADGRSLQIEFSWASNIEEEKNFVEMRGEKLGFTICNDQLTVYGEQAGHLTDTKVHVGPNFGHARYIRHFYDVAYNGAEPIYDIEEGVNMIRILNAMYESAATGKEVRL